MVYLIQGQTRDLIKTFLEGNKMKVYKLTHEVTKKIRYEVAESKRKIKKGADFQEVISLHMNEKIFNEHYCKLEEI